MKLRAVALAFSVVAGCSTNTQMSISRAPGFASEHPRVSVFAVLRNGRPSGDAWNELGPRLTATFTTGVGACEAGFGNKMRAANPSLFGEVEIEAKTDGISDESLGRAADSSNGDLVSVFEVWGGIGGRKKQAPTTSNAPAMPMGRRGRRGGGGGGRPSEAAEPDALELAARIYDPKSHEWVAAIEMRYTGSSVDEALQQLDGELAHLLPAATCSGWKW